MMNWDKLEQQKREEDEILAEEELRQSNERRMKE